MTVPSAVVITSKSVTVEVGDDNADVIIVEEPMPVVEKKAYDLMDDLLETDVVKLYSQVLVEEETQVKSGVKVQFGYFPNIPSNYISIKFEHL